MHCNRRLIVQTLVFSLSYLHRQVSPPDTLVVKGGSTWDRNGRWILSENARLPSNIQGSFTCRESTTWDKRLYLPSEGRGAEDFFALRNSTASTGFEPPNLGTKGQHATSRPPKLLRSYLTHHYPTFDGRQSERLLKFETKHISYCVLFHYYLFQAQNLVIYKCVVRNISSVYQHNSDVYFSHGYKASSSCHIFRGEHFEVILRRLWLSLSITWLWHWLGIEKPRECWWQFYVSLRSYACII